MRGVLVLVAAAAVSGCANDATAPVVQPQPSNALTTMSDSLGPGAWRFGRHGGMGIFLARRLPAALQLSDGQRAQIRSLMGSFRVAHAEDLAAARASMRSAMQQARAARASGQRLSADQRRSLFQQSAPARQRLMAAQRQLAADIQNVLTADQKAWLSAHRPAPCGAAGTCHARFARRGFLAGAQMRNPS